MNKVMSSALRYLTQREYSRAELTQRLLQKFTESEVLATVAWCEQHQLLSEQRFLESRIRHRISQGYGPRWIKLDLQQHSLAAEDIEEHLPDDEEFWIDQAFRLLLKKYKTPSASTQKIKMQGYLYQRGYTSAHIRQALMKFEHL